MNVAAFPKLEHARDVNDNHVQDDMRNSDDGTDDRCRNVQLVVPAPKRFRPSQPIHMTEERCTVTAKENINSSPVAGLGMPAISHLPWQLPLYRTFHQFPILQYPGYASYPFPVLPEHVHQNPYHAEYMKYFPNAVMLNSLHVPAVSPFFASSKELEPERAGEKLIENDNLLSKIANEEMKERRENSPQLIRMPTVFLDKDSVTDLKKKEGQTDNVKYQCDSCNKTYSTFSGLSKHKQFHCAQELKKEFTCKYCEKTYVSLGALKMHIRTHTLPCKCKICGKSFSRPWLLQGHVRTHTGEKPFTCVHCLRAFADRSNLRAHLQTHSDVKKYSCRSCSKTFSRMSLLLKHEDTCKSIAL